MLIKLMIFLGTTIALTLSHIIQSACAPAIIDFPIESSSKPSSVVAGKMPRSYEHYDIKYYSDRKVFDLVLEPFYGEHSTQDRLPILAITDPQHTHDLNKELFREDELIGHKMNQLRIELSKENTTIFDVSVAGIKRYEIEIIDPLLNSGYGEETDCRRLPNIISIATSNNHVLLLTALIEADKYGRCDGQKYRDIISSENLYLTSKTINFFSEGRYISIPFDITENDVKKCPYLIIAEDYTDIISSIMDKVEKRPYQLQSQVEDKLKRYKSSAISHMPKDDVSVYKSL